MKAEFYCTKTFDNKPIQRIYVENLPLWKQYKKVLPIEKMSLSNVYFEQLLPNINVSAYIQEVKKKGCSGPKTLLNGGELKNNRKNLTNISC